MASACLYLFFAKPNLIVNTDLLIILGNYFSLICKAEILYPPQFYLKRFILIQDPWVRLVTRLALARFGKVGDQVGQVKDQVSQGQGQELDNLQVSIFEKLSGGVVGWGGGGLFDYSVYSWPTFC